MQEGRLIIQCRTDAYSLNRDSTGHRVVIHSRVSIGLSIKMLEDSVTEE